MSLNMFWFLPTHGDGRYLGTDEGARPVDYSYLQQIAQAADRLGFTGVLIPTGRSCEDAWLVAASMIPVTQRLKFLVALRPSVTSPTVAARQAATLDRLSNGRALFNLVTGSDLDAIRVGGSDDSLISQNTLRDNVFGIHIADFAGDVTVSRNDISGSRDFGISASAGALDTIVSQNRVSTTARDGIYVPADAVNPALNTLVSQNTVFWNGDDGIDVAGSTTVTKNSAYENGALGIRASAEVEDGSGNKAWGNGDPMQCLNVVCSTG